MTEPAKKPSRSRPAPLLITESDPKSQAAEAYRTLRTSLQFANLDRPHRTLVVTSSVASEGKTMTVANFGVVAAQSGSRVCLLDADLRRPALHRQFGLGNARGLTTALLEDLPFAQVAQPTRVPGLSVVTSGPLPPNMTELVSSNRMRTLLEAATADFDLVVCDSPPTISGADAAALAAQCEGVIFVIRAGTLPHAVIRRALEQIEAVKGRVLGVILNHVNLRRDAMYYDYYRYYESYYGHPRK